MPNVYRNAILYRRFCGIHYVRGHSMPRLLVLVSLLLIAMQSKAATLERIVSSFAVHADKEVTESPWPTDADLPNIKWLDKTLRKHVRDTYVRYGTFRLHRHGTASIFLSGNQEHVSVIGVSISEREGRIFEQEQFTKVLRAQLKKQTKIELLERCPIGFISGLATYRVTLIGRKPVYVAAMTDAGGSAPQSRGSSFQLSHKHEDRWRCAP
jgi:hypothetical protein